MKEEPVRTICQFCFTGCGIYVHQDADGKISVKGDPDHPANRGQLCPKGYAIPEMLQGKNRLTHPLKKTKSGFKKISWDEALKIAADRLGEIRGKFGPTSLVRCGGNSTFYHGRDGFRQFAGAFGSPNGTSPASLCMMPRMTAFNAVLGGTRAEADYERTRLLIFWGSNPMASERYSAFASFNGMRHIIPRLKEQGVRIIAIDPFRSGTVKQADDWIKVNLGSDAALGLAMIHVIIKEGLYDEAFVAEYTHGFDGLKDHVQSCTPQWAEGITGVPEKDIENLARTYATTKPAAICDGNGLDMYTNGVDAVRTLAILMGLTGNLDVPGGNVFLPFAVQSVLPTKAVPREKRVWYDTFSLFVEVPMVGIKEAILREEDGRPRAMIVHHTNPVLIHAHSQRTRQALEKLDFVMVNEVVPTVTSEMADLVLPMADVLETYSFKAYSSAEGGYLSLSRPLADPIGEARPVFDVEFELAERMGLHQEYPFQDTMGWLRFMIEPTGVTLEQLEEEQVLFATPPVQYQKYLDKGFNTRSGKVEFFCQSFEAHGQPPFPVYELPAGEPLGPHNTADKGFPLMGSSRRPGSFIHTRFKYIETLSKIYPGPFVWIHPRDAAERDIKDGEEVEVTSDQGKIRITSKVSDDVKSGHVWLDFGWGNPTDGKANINSLTSDTYFNPVSGATPNRLFPCEVKKTG
ncbi:molybdopterin-dependent oxidoreductase [Thermodesulfobacteriota bacterium]